MVENKEICECGHTKEEHEFMTLQGMKCYYCACRRFVSENKK